MGVRVRWSLCIPPSVRVRAMTNGWMTTEEYQYWLLHIYGKESEFDIDHTVTLLCTMYV